MVHRVYVHAPALPVPEHSRKRAGFSAHHQLLSLAVVAASAFAYSTSSSHHIYYSTIVFVALGLLISLKHLVNVIQGRHRFQKAVIEITSFGVQLVSLYGHNDSSHNDSNMTTQATSSAVLDDERNVPATHNVEDNTHHMHKRLTHNTISKRQVRAFIPRERIIDVIVMEIVWPHCVWSQVAFRVDKGSESSLLQSKCSEEVENGSEHCRRRQLQELASSDDNHDNVHIQPNVEKCDDIDDQCASTSLNIHALMKQNRVAIVPAFPEECRGLLSYKECLRLQEEIERLLGHSETIR